MAPLTLNNFQVDPRLSRLMLRNDWEGCRGRDQRYRMPLFANRGAWLKRFKSHDEQYQIHTIEFLGVDALKSENSGLRNPEFSFMNGEPCKEMPPGDFDPENGYLIGFTNIVDDGIYVDLRPSTGPIITYHNGGQKRHRIVTAFSSIDEFVDFYHEQHGN